MFMESYHNPVSCTNNSTLQIQFPFLSFNPASSTTHLAPVPSKTNIESKEVSILDYKKSITKTIFLIDFIINQNENHTLHSWKEVHL